MLMKKSAIIERILNGEDSYTQFKVDIKNHDKLAEELVAFSNSKGGLLIIGVDDYSNIIGLKNDDIRRINQLIGNVINSNVIPPIYPTTKNEVINNKKLLIIEIKEGNNKPYSTNKGIYLTKAGSDKRKISPQELKRLFAQSENLFADEEIIHNSGLGDLDVQLYKKYLKNANRSVFNKLINKKLDLNILLENEMIIRNNKLTLAGNLLFGEMPQKFSPSFYIDCCYFDGNDISTTKFISKQTMKGTFSELFEDSLRFIKSQLRVYQVEKDFNYNGRSEINEEVLSELIINALIHRDYYINSSIKIFMFYDRVEIISPGKLTNSLTVEKIKSGISIRRNPVLSSICKALLPYTAYGSGIKRVVELNPNIKFINDTQLEQFKCIIPRTKLKTNMPVWQLKEESSPYGLEVNEDTLGVNSNKLGVNKDTLGVNSNMLGVNEDTLGVNSNKLGVKLSKNKILILKLIKQNQKITISMLSNAIGITTTAIENNIKSLKKDNFLKRVGSDKTGHWEVIEHEKKYH